MSGPLTKGAPALVPDARYEPATTEIDPEGVTLLLDLTEIVLAQHPAIQVLFLWGLLAVGLCAVLAKPVAQAISHLIARKER